MAKRNVGREVNEFLNRHGYHHSGRKTKGMGSMPAARSAARASVDPLSVVQQAVQEMGPEGRFLNSDKVYIAAVWDAVGDQIGMSLPAFKQWLIQQNRQRTLDLARGDLVSQMDPRLLDRSAIHVGSAEFQFIIDPAWRFEKPFSARRVTSKPVPAPVVNAVRPSPSRGGDPLTIVQRAVQEAGPEARFGVRKVFIAPVWDAVGRQLGMSLPEFKRWLLAQNQEMRLSLARADLVGAMDRNLLDKSEINDFGARFHFIVDPSL